MFFDPLYFILITPALLLGLWANLRVRSTYARALRMPASLTGAAAARYILDSAGLQDVAVDLTPGELSDHYSPTERVIRLSPNVYRGNTLAAVGIAAHEAGHAIQHARAYAPLVFTQAIVPVAGFGSNVGLLALLFGIGLGLQWLAWAGVILFSAVVLFQVVNLPVEFNASNRAKRQLVALGIVPPEEMAYVNKVLNAAALTYVAATLQAVLTLFYYLLLVTGRSDE